MKILQAAVRVSLLLALALVLANSAAWAQEATGKILGTVTDPQGGVIPGAKVTVTNVATGVGRETTTDRDGFYQVLSLPIGTYRVTVEHPGFRKGAVDNQTLQINQVLRIDIPLELGSPTQVVEVSAQIAGVETVNYTLGQSITVRPLVNLPLNGRNIYDLALLIPGVTETNPGSPGLFSIAGGRADSVTFLLDGGVNNNLLSNTVVFLPSPDQVEEFRILSSNYSAEYGRNAGGIVSVVTKSGSNSYHGSVFEFLRNDALNANTFFRNRDVVPREILKRNQFGFAAGGPISIPKVVNGKDRFFFYAGYQGQRLVQQQTNPAVTVFTPAELGGDFSRSGPGGTPDTGVVAFLQSHPFFQSNPALAAQAIIDPGVAGNPNRPSRINSVAQRYISKNLIPTSLTGTLSSPTGGASNNNDQITGKFDAAMTSKDKLAVTLGAFRNTQLNPFTAEGNVPGFPVTQMNHRYFANIAYTRTFSPNLLNEFRFTTQRNHNFQNVPARTLPKSTELGIGIISDNPTGPTQLQFFDKRMSLGFSRNGPSDIVDNTFSWSDTFSWIKGKHSLKFGFSGVPYQDNQVFDFFINGRFRFRGTRFTGNNFADFLVGTPFSYLQFPEAPSDIRTKAYYAFAQDEWHVTRNLTFTLGVRYEYSTPKLDTKGRSFTVELGQRSTVFPNAPIGLLFPGDPQAPRGANFPARNNWAPRFGFAWDPTGNGKMSVRGGFGVFYDILKGEDNFQFNGQAPFFGFADLRFAALSANPTAEVNYMPQPFVGAGQPNPFPSRPPAPTIDFDAAGFLPFGGSGVFFVNPNLRTPYNLQYSLSFQREVVRNMAVEASYVGSVSRKLTSLVDANPFILGTRNRIFNTTPGNTSGSFSFLPEFRNVASASFSSLELGMNKRVSDNRIFGTTYFIFAYTYGHSIDNASGFRQNTSTVPFYSPHQFIGSSDYDLRHRISFGGGWDLPFDRAWSSGPKRLTKGWSIYPIITYRTGFPLNVSANLDQDRTIPGPSGAGDSNLVRANLVSNSVTIFDPKNPQTLTNPTTGRTRTGNFWFNPANVSALRNAATLACSAADPAKLPSDTCAVGNPAVRTYGTLPRNFFRGPGRTNVNFAIAKNTTLWSERVSLLFRAEFFNLFNTAQFANPDIDVGSNTFGQITTVIQDSQRIIQFGAKISF